MVDDSDNTSAPPVPDALDFLSNGDGSLSFLGNIERFEFEHEIELYADYLATLEEFFQTEMQKLDDGIKRLRAAKKIEHFEDGEQDGDEQTYDFYSDRMEQFINMQRRAFLVSIYAFLEARLESECDSRKADEILLSFSEIKGRNKIDRAKTYFKKVLRASFPSDSQEWVDIQNLREIRNCIVHNQGRIRASTRPDEKLALKKFIARKNNLPLGGDEIFLSKRFCEEAYRTVKTFLSLLLFGEKVNQSP